MEDFYQSRALFRTQDILDYFTSVRSMQAKLKALIEVGRIAKIKNGLYATVNPLTGDVFASRFEIASALFENAWKCLPKNEIFRLNITGLNINFSHIPQKAE